MANRYFQKITEAWRTIEIRPETIPVGISGERLGITKGVPANLGQNFSNFFTSLDNLADVLNHYDS